MVGLPCDPWAAGEIGYVCERTPALLRVEGERMFGARLTSILFAETSDHDIFCLSSYSTTHPTTNMYFAMNGLYFAVYNLLRGYYLGMEY